MCFGVNFVYGKYDLSKGYLFALSWARVRQVMRGSISSVLLMCGGGVCSILLLPLVARCLDTVNVWRMLVFMSVVVTVWGSVRMENVCCVVAVVKKGVFSLVVLKYVVCLCSGCVFSVCIGRHRAVGGCVWEV